MSFPFSFFDIPDERSRANEKGILDSVKNGKRVSEAGYGVIQDPVRSDHSWVR